MYSPLAFIGNLGWPEILIILFVALLIFGGKRLPTLAKDLGDGIRSFRKSLSGESDSESAKIEEPETKSAPTNKKSKKSA
ncbi:twin-arginine translocase TatA/TatE family subunit [Leptospira wolffii]|uniref:Sec-independent protein translocase protein TatA n=1 Tax=Leptospira wolffii TaxID=409998 RepID=A0A2M9ZD67_9LEPT|nr:twin-arginine translocase TatA/TatE family subunit [Leptospira wolffii]EPG68102.1 twin arginine-targeting protein translocase, TatA/E family [Leptospira wolffii serovar Khorat str. Khorat-H2]PJZ66366.1 twin-arginine translocase TatA/TatE family subunit [Leptospira wolffii]TGK60075.1 twin-arginine translocase TatA/TatE family subunit [Leptospira wolffii]TGK72418.1 twin-arginine translocase TatA/TatE family subunit [Leptospira wolffii]TGK76082.1 twin-arginine translocase TatA/TatE family subu